MAIRIDLHDKAASCLERAELQLEEYDKLAGQAQEAIPPRELALRRTLTDLLWALQLTHEAVGG
jgi:hypothetical protein